MATNMYASVKIYLTAHLDMCILLQVNQTSIKEKMQK